MKIRDTLYFNWYKHLFIVFIIGVFLVSSMRITSADFQEVFNNTDQISEFVKRFLNPDFSYIPDLIDPMMHTIKMSILGTALGVVVAIPFSFLATVLVTGNYIITLIIRFILDIIRTIPNLLLAALMVAIVGIGEFTGVLTISIFTFGVVSQLIFESIETIDYGPVEAGIAVGANRIQIAFFSILPQILPQIASYAFYALEINIRASTVLGYVGAGGIGVILNSSLALLQYSRVSIIIIIILIVVTIVDFISEICRRRLK